MSHQPHPRRLTPLVLAAAGAALCAPVQAEQRGTLRIEIQVKGEEAWQENGSWEKGSISQRYSISTALTSDGGRSAVNILDPHSTQAAQERSGEMREQVAQVQKRQKSLEAAGGMPNAQVQQDMNAAIMQAYQRCKGDETCIRDAVTKSSPQLMATPPGMSFEPGGRSGSGSRVQAPREVYQQWLGFDGCPGSFKAVREDLSDGLISDVGAARPRKFAVRLQDAGERPGLCNSYAMTTVDTDRKLLFVESFALPAARAQRSSQGTGVQGVQTVDTIPPEIRAWIDRSLRGIPLSGNKSETLVLKQPIVVSPWKGYRGTATVSISWSFTYS